MKRAFKIKWGMMAVLSAVLFLASCEKDPEWGVIRVYMPQAVIYDGGVTNIYPVPLNNNPTTNNYKIDSDGNLLITLGVYRSGLQELKPFSVTVYADMEKSRDEVSAAADRVLLPEGYWSLPSNVAVESGSRESIFYLKVRLKKLQQDYPDMFDKKAVLTVGVSNPTLYELNADLSETTVIIDCIKFFAVPPPPELVPGGEFNSGDEVFWNFANASNETPEDCFTIADGKLTIRAEEHYGNLVGEYWVELNETLVPGKTYELTMDVTANGVALNSELDIGLAPEHSTDGYRYPIKNAVENGASPEYKDYFFASIDAWWDGAQLTRPFSGILPKDSNYTYGFNSGSTTFTAGENQKYLCIQACAWDGYLGVITIDNVSLKEKR